MEVSKTTLTNALRYGWTSDTSSVPSEWSETNASRGQCVPTALVAQDYLGGEIEKLVTVFGGKEESHYRNLLDDGSIFDASCSQYPINQVLTPAVVALNGFSSIREKRLSEPDVMRRYELLKTRVQQKLANTQ